MKIVTGAAIKWHLSNCSAFLSSQKNKDRLSTELNATDNLSLAKHHKTTVTSNDINNHYPHWHKPFFPAIPTILFLTGLFFSRFSSVIERWLWSLLICDSKLKNSFTKWQSPWRIIESNRRINLSLPDDLICPSVVIICSDSWIFSLLICTPLPLFQVPLRPLVGLRPPSNYVIHSLSTRSVQETTPEGVVSSCGCSLTLTLTTSQKVYGRVRVPRHLDSPSSNCPVLHHFSSDFYFSRWGWEREWVHIGSLESKLRATIVSDGTSSIHHQASLDFSGEDRSNT